MRLLTRFGDLPPSDAPCDEVFFDRRWFEHLEQSTGVAEGDLRIYSVALENGRYFSLPMMGSTSSLAGTGLRSLVSLANFYTPVFGPCTDAPAETQARLVADIVAAIHAEAADWETLVFQPLATESAFYAALQPALRKAGYLCDDFFSFGNWYLPVAGRDFKTYFDNLPSVLRNTVERARRKLIHNQHGRIEILARNDAQLQPAIDAFDAVYRRSWKNPEPFPRFIPGLCQAAAEAGWLRLGVLHVGDTPAAAQIWLCTPAKASIYKLAYDQEYAKMSVGSVLSAAMFEHALNRDRVQEIDYLVGDESYKRGWMSHRRERRGIIAFNPRRPRALLAAARHYAGAWLNRLRG